MLKLMKDFMRGCSKLPKVWQAWLGLLVFVNMVLPLFLWSYTEARWTFAAIMTGVILGHALLALQGFTRLLGLMHLPWLILIPFLWGRIDLYPTSMFVGLWIRSVVILNSISVVVDAIDVVRYLRGDRKSSI